MELIDVSHQGVQIPGEEMRTAAINAADPPEGRPKLSLTHFLFPPKALDPEGPSEGMHNQLTAA
jgi:hypothetical protein